VELDDLARTHAEAEAQSGDPSGRGASDQIEVIDHVRPEIVFNSSKNRR
jgi:hypothetical protein